MKRILLMSLSLAILFTSCIKENQNQVTFLFEDPNFEAYLLTNFDDDDDGKISCPEAAKVEILEMWGLGIKSLKGIEAFQNLKYIMCDDNELTTLDVSQNPALEELWCGGMALTELDVSKNIKLKVLAIGGNPITEIDLSQNTMLEELKFMVTDIASLDVSNNISLTTLWCDVTPMKQLDLSRNVMLQQLTCAMTPIAELDLSKNVRLQELVCESTKLTKLDMRANIRLERLYCRENPQLTELILGSGARSGGAIELMLDKDDDLEVTYRD